MSLLKKKSLIDNIKELISDNQGTREGEGTGWQMDTHKLKTKPITFKRIFKNAHGPDKRPHSNFGI